MARIRTIKPEHTLSEKIGHLSDRAYRLWIALLCNADDEGLGTLRPEELRMKVYGYQPKITSAHVSAALTELSEANLIAIFTAEAGGKTFYEMHDWLDHQKIQHPTPSKLPHPPLNGVKSPVSGGLMRTHEDLFHIINPHPDLTDQGSDQGSRIKDQGSKPPIVPQNLGDALVQSEPASAKSEPSQKKVRKGYSAGFLRFCDVHPWGTDSQTEAWDVWQRKKLEDVANEICAATETQKTWSHKARNAFEYFSRMPSYLRKERWKDKPPEISARNSPPPDTPGGKAFKVLEERNRQDEERQHGNRTGN